MYAEPPGFDRQLLATTLKAGWGIEAGRLDYIAVGFGTHHYRTGNLWVNVDAAPTPATKPRLDKALRAVVSLAGDDGNDGDDGGAGLEFVHPPLPLREGDGGCVAEMPGYAVSVFEVIEGESFKFGTVDPRLREAMLQALRRLHAVPPASLRAQPEPASFRIAHRDTIFEGLGHEWTSGHSAKAHAG